MISLLGNVGLFFLDNSTCEAWTLPNWQCHGAVNEMLKQAGMVCGGLEDVVGAVKGFLRAQ